MEFMGQGGGARPKLSAPRLVAVFCDAASTPARHASYLATCGMLARAATHSRRQHVGAGGARSVSSSSHDQTPHARLMHARGGSERRPHAVRASCASLLKYLTVS